MITKIDKNKERKNRHRRVRKIVDGVKRVSGRADMPRLNVYKSLKGIYAQIIDDTARTTLVSASTMEKGVAEKIAGLTKTEAAKVVGKIIGEKAIACGITKIVFDRGGYLYTGRVAALAEGAREAGLSF